MRVLHLASSFPRHPLDHNAPWLLDLLRAQAAAGVSVAVLAPHDRGLPLRERWGDVEVVRFRYAPGPWEKLAYRGGLLAAAASAGGRALVPGLLAAFAAATAREVRRLRPDVVHAHWWLPGGMAAAVALGHRHPLVVTLHGSDVHLASQRAWRPLCRAVLSRALVVLAASDWLAEEATGLLGLPPGRVGVGRMPVARREPGEGAATSPGAPPSPLRLVAVGRLVHEKGFDVLLDALGLLVGTGVDARLEIVGEGPLAASLRERAAHLGERVRWLAPMPRGDLARHMAGAAAVVVPSRREGLGLVALEALAAGCPVVASRVGGLHEIVADGADGALVAPDDPPALAAALRRLPLPPPRGAALARHSPETVASAHVSAYHEAIQRHEHAGPRRAGGRHRWS